MTNPLVSDTDTLVVEREAIVNDFNIVVATANGSGSQTANLVLMRSLFKMGIPVSGKNLFPSNIQGLPTWYTIRVSHQGYTARRAGAEIVVAFNPETSDSDHDQLLSGGVCMHPADMKFSHPRTDIVYYALPSKEWAKAAAKQFGIDPKMVDYLANMAYVGALMALLDIDATEVRAALERHFQGKSKPIQSNWHMIETAANYAREQLTKTDPYRVAPLNQTTGMTMIDGNTAGALGALTGGVTVCAWYPITPSTSLVDALTDYAPKLRRDPETNLPTYAIIQAEDELAAAGMIVGAGWMGARAMTATSGPGISLMSEFAGMAYFAEVPAVIWDIQRMGPSTGLPTRVSQGDLLSTYFLGHGDTRHVVLLPASMQECFEFGWRAFDLAERLQTLVFVLSDLDLGMNNWMTAPFEYPETPLDRGKVLNAEDLDQLTERWGRYRDSDGDGIPYRTLPGNPHPKAAYLTRGTGHNEYAVYSERSDDWLKNLDRLRRKHDTARSLVPQPVVDLRSDARIGLIAYGSTDPAISEARDQLREAGLETSYIRLRALPLNEVLDQFVAQHERVYVIELNDEGQMHQLVRLHLPERANDIVSVRLCDGLPMTAQFVTNSILERERQ
jgi:2-oxoglutarate ferredoxin oxidoreductase subunit alpha